MMRDHSFVHLAETEQAQRSDLQSLHGESPSDVWKLLDACRVGSPNMGGTEVTFNYEALSLAVTQALDEVTRSRDAWKAKTREEVRLFLTEHPDLKIREILDRNGVLEAKLDLAATQLALARERALVMVTALKWYADPENNGKRKYIEVDGVDVGAHRWIDEDEGDVAREALLTVGEAEVIPKETTKP